MQNLLDPAILFFVFGVFAGAVRSDLEIPPAVSKFLSLYLLMALGLKGGFALAQSGLTPTVAVTLACAMLMAFAVPVMGYAILKRFTAPFDAAAIAAAYGSVSAVTFVTAIQYLDGLSVPVGGHMPVAMVLMESPAILVGVVLANALRSRSMGVSATVVAGTAAPAGGRAVAHVDATAKAASQAPAQIQSHSVGTILHESLTNGAHMLLIGGMLVGLLSGETGKAVMQPFSADLFKGMLSFFLLDMGLMVARNFKSARQASWVLVVYAVLGPLLHASLALGLARLCALPVGDAVLLMVLSASASYIVVPAVLRDAIPEANPALYFGLSLGITFPLNLLVGIPLYTQVAQVVLR